MKLREQLEEHEECRSLSADLDALFALLQSFHNVTFQTYGELKIESTWLELLLFLVEQLHDAGGGGPAIGLTTTPHTPHYAPPLRNPVQYLLCAIDLQLSFHV